VKEKIQEVLDKNIRPVLERDGGGIELVDANDGIVKVKLKGACAGCPMSQLTMVSFVEKLLKEQVPEIKKVESVI